MDTETKLIILLSLLALTILVYLILFEEPPKLEEMLKPLQPNISVPLIP